MKINALLSRLLIRLSFMDHRGRSTGYRVPTRAELQAMTFKERKADLLQFMRTQPRERAYTWAFSRGCVMAAYGNEIDEKNFVGAGSCSIGFRDMKNKNPYEPPQYISLLTTRAEVTALESNNTFGAATDAMEQAMAADPN